MRSAPSILLLAVCGLLHPLAGQDLAAGWMYRFEVFGEVARGTFYNGDSNWGNGLDLGGGIGFRPFSGKLRGLGFELRAARLSDEKAMGPGSAVLASRFVSADALYHFRGRTRFQPYVLGGLGFVNAHYTGTCNQCVFNLDPVTHQLTPIPQEWETRASKAGLTLGFGLKIAAHRHISVRPEILFLNTTPGSGWNWAWLRAQVGVGWHF